MTDQRPVLERALDKLGVLPAREFCSVEQLRADFVDVYDLLDENNIPNKKPRKSINNPSPSLTKEQKIENRSISRMRVVVEQATGGFKCFNILVQRFRNHLDGFVDIAVLLAAGFWNLKLRCQGVTY